MRLVNKTKVCHCCEGSGEEFDHKFVGFAMRELRNKKGLTLAKLGQKMDPPLHTTYLSDLERGARNWNERLISQYRKLTK